MKSVLISIQPKWCELIASGKKTIEVRKTKPKLETPFKVYIYCTKPRHYYKISRHLLISDESLFLINGNVRMCDGFGVEYEDSEYKHLNCKVIGEFVCDNLKTFEFGTEYYQTLVGSCLTGDEVWDYGKGKTLYGWHISDLVIYDKPRELSEFYKPCAFGEDDVSCFLCEKSGYAPDMHIDCFNKVTRPPQSWCYVEEVHNG